jgi:hypothetical protein
MAKSYTVTKNTTTNIIGHKYVEDDPLDTYTKTRFFTKFSSVTQVNQTLNGTNEDGSIKETETIATGIVPDTESP